MAAATSLRAALKKAQQVEVQQHRRIYKFTPDGELIWELRSRRGEIASEPAVKVAESPTKHEVLGIYAIPSFCEPKTAVAPMATPIPTFYEPQTAVAPVATPTSEMPPPDDSPKKTGSFRMHDFSGLEQHAGLVEPPLQDGAHVDDKCIRPHVVRPFQSLLDRRRQSIAARRCLAGPTAPCDSPRRAGGRPLSAKPCSTGSRPVSAMHGRSLPTRSNRTCDRPISEPTSCEDHAFSAQSRCKSSRPFSAKPNHASTLQTAKPHYCPVEELFAGGRPASAKLVSRCIDDASSCKARTGATARGSKVLDACQGTGQKETSVASYALPTLEGG
eukprot:TRINITY_DN103952_c0_g1_i1.p1 TRINITY_DN103952_c0_g1~~TRINITY_DN103952_c0_g1_i1.p1  ORF type:complete len:344 (-),score=52.92 TRINITY_DN103952_c0_g1_i1:44-1033(-)